ncbi:MAG: response regulator transcription factor [Candidatus Limnocylindrales bacterium]
MKLLLLEDDVRLSGLLQRGLRADGHAVDAAATIEDGRWHASEGTYDALILDVMLPDGDGFAFCAELRAAGNWTPVLMLTARDAVEDRVRGLDVGADDYLVKPFAFVELLARLRALVRRGPSERPTLLTVGALVLDPAAHRVTVAGREVPLSSRQFALLEFLMRHPDEALSRTTIIERVWDWAYEGTSNIVDVYVRALRVRLREYPESPTLDTVRGVGYMLRTRPARPPTGAGRPPTALPAQAPAAPPARTGPGPT